eukprot:CAMPEP_0172664622 /NCGR_PEP_ID=MMETSP1074-20121228/6725_1 /TAXON_ID=2916 /ORGANISM="Ceratium fusus, Strain PA161109" /LENGTH=163 /DNA_ID=CAMNT_0013480807 /DNA_START=124 /DNA_END=616 /DNA_ORIENTATION=+
MLELDPQWWWIKTQNKKKALKQADGAIELETADSRCTCTVAEPMSGQTARTSISWPESRAGQFKVVVNTVGGNSSELELSPSSTVADVKGKLEKMWNTPKLAQRLILGGSEVIDADTLTSLNFDKAQSLEFFFVQDAELSLLARIGLSDLANSHKDALTLTCR